MLSLQGKARELLDRNARKGKSFYYTAPSRKKYPHQWSWDSSFCAIANCRLGRADLAKAEILTLLGSILPDGTLPHLIMRRPTLSTVVVNRLFRSYWPCRHCSPLVQPPVVALAAYEVWKTTEDGSFLRESLPLLWRHFDWLWTHRRSGSSALLSIFSPWESGLDHKPGFDPFLGWMGRLPLGRYAALYTMEVKLAWHGFDPDKLAKKGPFNVREVLFNTVYALGLEALASMFAAAGDTAKAEVCRSRNEQVEAAILSECFDADTGLCYDVEARSGRLIPEPAVSSLIPLALGRASCQQYEALLSHLTNPGEFWLSYPVPSVPRNSRHFRPASTRYLWRGPTWINTNWLIAEGLRRNGQQQWAEAIAGKSRELVERSGFWEYYNPLTGKGGGEEDFSWSTLAAVM